MCGFYKGIQFEVFGKVQGVFFRVYTEKKAQELNLVGWCRNTSRGTVEGEIEGQEKDVNEMKVWLSTVGSPNSKIEDCKIHFFRPRPI